MKDFVFPMDDRDLGTFNPLFPRGNYFSELALLGPRVAALR